MTLLIILFIALLCLEKEVINLVTKEGLWNKFSNMYTYFGNMVFHFSNSKYH